jgi:voltage-gated potassium channel Kch
MHHGLVFGLALSVASTVVLLRALQERRLVETERGRIAVGWLIVEDIAMVLALVLLPVLADTLKGGAGQSLGVMALLWPLVLTLAKVAGFVVLMLIVGRRVIPWIMHWVAHTGSRELVIDTDADALGTLTADRVETIRGNAVNKEVLIAANLAAARCLLVAAPDAFEGGYAVEFGRKANPQLTIIARSHSEDETAHLKKYGATEVVMGEHEIAKAMIAGIPPRLDVADPPSAAAKPQTTGVDGAAPSSAPA